MIIARLLTATRFVRWTHILQFVRSAEFQSPNMLNDPTLSHPIDDLATDHTGATRTLPGLKPSVP